MKTTQEIIRDSAMYLKDEIIVINDNDKKWYSEEEIDIYTNNIKDEVIIFMKDVDICLNELNLSCGSKVLARIEKLRNELFGDEE